MAITIKIAVIFAVFALVAGAPSDLYEKEPARPYDFEYAVKDEYSGNDFGHNEISDGAITSGRYFVLLPDGRLQTVTYTADHDSGFIADVAYEGEAVYPVAEEKSPAVYAN